MSALDNMIKSTVERVFSGMMENSGALEQANTLLQQIKARFDRIDADNALILKAQEAIAARLAELETREIDHASGS